METDKVKSLTLAIYPVASLSRWAAVHFLYNWYAVPVGAPPIGPAHTFGVSLLVPALAGGYNDTTMAVADVTKVALKGSRSLSDIANDLHALLSLRLALQATIGPLFLLALGWVTQLFI